MWVVPGIQNPNTPINQNYPSGFLDRLENIAQNTTNLSQATHNSHDYAHRFPPRNPMVGGTHHDRGPGMPARWRNLAIMIPVALLASLAGLLPLALQPARAQPQGQADIWYIARVDGQPVGSWRHQEQATADGWTVRQTLELRVRRYGAIVALTQEYSNTETEDGKVTGFSLKQVHNGKAFLHLQGRPLEGDSTLFKVDDLLGRPGRQLAWAPEVTGLRSRERLPLSGQGPYRVLAHEPLVNLVVGLEGTISQEAIDQGGAKAPCQKVSWQPRILQPGAPTLSPTRWWIDPAGRIVRRQFELDGMGLVTLDLSTREGVSESARVAPMRDLGDSSLVGLDRPIPNARLARAVVLRLLWKEPTGEPLDLANDERQQARPAADGGMEVVSRKGQKPRRVVGAPDAAREFTGTSKFIDTDHPRIRELAQRAGGFEDDCWTAALRLERYVSRNLRPDAAAALVPASEFCSTWRGDCRHAALALAALCRASNMPARTAVGLLYVEKGGRPALGFHMWTEVFIDGQWIGLDGTLGQGGVGAGHVKVSDHSWDKVESLAPLLSVQRLVGRLKGEVVRVDLGD